MKISVPEIIDRESMDELEKIGEFSSNIDNNTNILVVRSKTNVTKELIDSLPDLKLVVRAGIGLDNIDLDYCKEKEITVKNTPTASTISVAELVMAHMLTSARGLVEGTIEIKKGEWPKKKLIGIELYEKILGIVGYGRIGRAVKERAAAFGMDVIAYDPFLKDADVPLVELNDLFEKSDVITLHVPLTPKTKNLISKKEIEIMKEGVIIINASRGGVIDEDSLREGLKGGKIRCAGLDVFSKEPYIGELIKVDNIALTPHIGANTIEAQKRVGQEVVKIVKEFMENEVCS